MGRDYDEKVFSVHIPSILQMIPLVLWWVLVQSGHREAQITSFVLRQKNGCQVVCWETQLDNIPKTRHYIPKGSL